MVRKILSLTFVLLMLLQCACGLCPDKYAEEGTVASDGAELTRLATTAASKQVKAYQAIYVRGGSNGDFTYEQLLKEYPAGSGKELILKRNTKEGNSNNDREIIVQYDLLDILSDMDKFKHAYITFSGTSRDEDIGDVLVYVYETDVDLSKLTFNNRPQGTLVMDNYRISAAVPCDIWPCVEYALNKGMSVLTLRFVGKNTTKGEHRYSGDVQKLPALQLTSTPRDGSIIRDIFETQEENEALWAYAEKLYNEWYERYLALAADAKNDPDVALIQSDPDQYTKVVTWAEHIGWKDHPEITRTFDALDDLSDYVDISVELPYDKYGGLMDPAKKQEATGFFYAKEIDGRWWIIDPLGFPCHVRSVSGITIQYSPGSGQKQAALDQYGTQEKWMLSTIRRLKDGLYFNCTTKRDGIDDVENTLFQVISIGGFATGYGTELGVNAGVGGMSRFSENNSMPVFDPAFEEYSDARAKEQTALYKGNERILGLYTDNELPIGDDMLANYLSVEPTKTINGIYINAYSYACAWTFLMKQTGSASPAATDATDEMRQLFQGFVWDRYLNVVCGAVRKYDNEHMLMGTKFLAGVLESEWVCRSLGTYIDCMNINWYGAWEPQADLLQKLAQRARLPFMVTEFYAKAVECEGNLAHTDSGAGYLVKTQKDRGYFYQNYTLRLLESPNSIGWQWFQYLDCDPSGTQTDISSKDSNKGIFSNTHKEYTDLTDEMIKINKNIYHLIDYFDQKYGR